MKLLVLTVTLVLCFLGANGLCPTGWKSNETSCYLYFHEAYTFFEAKVACDTVQAMLVEIESPAENTFIQNMALGGSGGLMWMGMEDFVVEGTYQFAGSHLTPEYYNWAAGDPNNLHNNQDCVAMRSSSAEWVDLNCEDKHNFVCETEGSEGEMIGR